MPQKIIFQNESGGVSIITPADCGLTIEQIAAKDVPTGTPYAIIDDSALPSDRTFRAAWEKSGSAVVENIDKCKLVAHEMRRAARSAEFAPLDIQSTIPSIAAETEATRQAVRHKYDVVQKAIDASATVGEIKAATEMIDIPASGDYGMTNFLALVRRRAKDLQQSGQEVSALLLLKTIGE